MSRTDHNLFGAAQEKADLDTALEQYRREWGPFMREHGITLPQLRSLDGATLIALTFLNLNRALGERLNDHERRLRALETEHNPVQPPDSPEPTKETLL